MTDDYSWGEEHDGKPCDWCGKECHTVSQVPWVLDENTVYFEYACLDCRVQHLIDIISRNWGQS